MKPKITILVHTRNRPAFLFRLLRYFDSVSSASDHEIMVLDASDENEWAEFQRLAASPAWSIKYNVLRHDASLPIYERIWSALQLVSTPYVLLAADDDIYFFEWIEHAVAFLDSNPGFGIVYGHTIRFELPNFQAFGTTAKYFIDSVQNPPARWLEGATAAGRLLELGHSRGGIATTGWYALQRASHLRRIIELARTYKMNNVIFERFLIFAQAALCKTRQMDSVYLARQVGSRWEPLSYKENKTGIETLKRASLALLVNENTGMTGKECEEIVRSVFFWEIWQMKRADRKRHLRAIGRRLPYLKKLWDSFYFGHEPLYDADARLLPPPRIRDCASYIAIVGRAVGEAR